MMKRLGIALLSTSALLASAAMAPAVQAHAPAASTSSASVVAPTKSRPPAVLTAQGAANQVKLTWRPPAATVEMDPAPRVRYDVIQAGAGIIESRATAVSFTVTGLNDNTKYTFTVVSYINGKRSGKKSVTGLTLPGKLVNPRAEGNSKLAWNPPEFASEPLTYNVYLGQNLYAVGVTDTFLTVPAPEEGKSVSYSVVAVNPTGEGPKSTVTVSTPKPPRG